MYAGSANQLKGYDAWLIDHGYTIEELIDHASDCLLPHFLDYTKAAVFVGPGNNGGDGLSLAEKLHDKGKEVLIFYMGAVDRFSQGNRYYYNRCQKLGLSMTLLTEQNIAALAETLKSCDVVVDALFGFGLNSAPRGIYAQVIDILNTEFDGDVIAVDIPTGLGCNTGVPYANTVYATKTITLTALKEGFLNPDARMFTGDIILETLDVDNAFMEAGLFRMVDEDWARAHLKSRKYDGYKNMYGTDLLICGSETYKGAPLLAAKACVNAGAGIVKLMSVSSVCDNLPIVLPEAIGIRRPNKLTRDDVKGYNAILIGPGLGLDLDAVSLVTDTLRLSECPLVMDADALTILAQNLDLLKGQERDIVLTPHLGEFRRLCDFGEDDDLMETAAAFAKKHHVILVLKGPKTIVTNGHESYRIDAGGPAMSTGGMGDTLAGIMTAFLGGMYEPMDAVVLATFLHSFAGDALARKRYTVLPDQLSAHLPQIMFYLNQKEG